MTFKDFLLLRTLCTITQQFRLSSYTATIINMQGLL